MYKRRRYNYRVAGDDDEEDEEELAREIGKNTKVKCEDNHIYFYDDVNSDSILALNQYIRRLNTLLLNTKADINEKYLKFIYK